MSGGGAPPRSAGRKWVRRDSGATVVLCFDSGPPPACSCSIRPGGSCCSARWIHVARSGSRRAAVCTAVRAWRPPRSGNWPRKPGTSGPRPTSGRSWRPAPGCGRPSGGLTFFGADAFFLVRVTEPRVDTDGQEALERSVITGHRWWTAGELRATNDKIVPNELADLVDGLLSDGVPATPVRPGGHDAKGPGSRGPCRLGRRGTRPRPARGRGPRPGRPGPCRPR